MTMRDMTVRVVTDHQELLEMADEQGALPRTAGVQVVYVDRERFGYDDAGQPFDEGSFSG